MDQKGVFRDALSSALSTDAGKNQFPPCTALHRDSILVFPIRPSPVTSFGEMIRHGNIVRLRLRCEASISI
jgi:hypothetical protein